MLKQLILENWKSFRYAELPIDQLTVLIGTNASGKSNVVEALDFLQRIARGEDIKTALTGNETLPSIRGGVEWVARKPENQFTLKALIQGEDENTDYLYTIQIQTQQKNVGIKKKQIRPDIRVIKENIQIYNPIEKYIPDSLEFSIKNANFQNQSSLKHSLVGYEYLQNIKFNKEQLSEINSTNQNDVIYKPARKAKENIISALMNIFIFNPIPAKMRNYSQLSDSLESDASNIAGVLAGLSDEKKTEVETTISTHIKNLPEGDIKRVWAEKVGRFGTDAMLYCEEEWKPGAITEIDARSMSDGTLRFLAILTALLTRPEGSQLVIEDVDDGLHPSRSELLVRMLREIGKKRNIDILITTHNPTLLDAFGSDIIPFVVVSHRDVETGDSKLTVLEDIQNFPKLFASASLGKLTTSGAIERSLSRDE
ncbi:MAG: AAA family ATPase [Calothrix sp. MO_192.B10]|nr:AAA family ATPase [Calothrix sp. MO_192.B10]